MRSAPDTLSIQIPVVNTDVAAGGDAVISIAANAEQQWVIDFIGGGYYAAPDANTALVVNDVTNNTILYQTPVTAAGPIYFPLPPKGLPAPKGSALTITLEDGSQIKDLCVQYR